MRIDAMSNVSQLYAANRTKKSANSNSVSPSDKFELSQAGKDYQVAKAAVAGASDVREDRVAQIKAAMANGTYNISNEKLADKMLDYFDI